MNKEWLEFSKKIIDEIVDDSPKDIKNQIRLALAFYEAKIIHRHLMDGLEKSIK